MACLATVAAFGFDQFNTVELLKRYRQLGCCSCQFYRNIGNPPDPSQARRIATDVGVPIDSVHGLFGPGHDLSSLDASARQAMLANYRLEGELALELGASSVVVHPAPRAESAAQLNRQMVIQRIPPLCDSLVQLAQMGRQLGVVYLIENLPPDYLIGRDPIQLAQMIRDLNDPYVRMCFDVGHAHMTGQVAGALEACLDVISYVHVHDNDGMLDSHLIPGKGCLPWQSLAPTMACLAHDTPAMLELFITESDLDDLIALDLADRLGSWLSLEESS